MAPFRVLVVDDEPEFLRLASHALCAAGFDVTTTEAEWAAAVLMAADRDAVPFDVLVTDLWMPHVSGIDLIERARSFDVPVAVLAISGDGFVPHTLALRPGIDDFLGKPFRLTEFVDRVAKLVERTALRSAAAPPASSDRKGTSCTRSNDTRTATS